MVANDSISRLSTDETNLCSEKHMGSLKRVHEDGAVDSAPKKRAKETTKVDSNLVKLYDDLANEVEDVRLGAAHDLLSNHLSISDDAQTKAVLKRLFRGLCSGRKAARLGFSVALTEALRIKEGQFDVAAIIDILESQTTPESNTTGQDERDHYFGRLFGSDAVIRSNIVFSKTEFHNWQKLLDLICNTSAKKPWLRQQCGWILYEAVKLNENNAKFQPCAVEILNQLKKHNLIRTPEGLGVWMIVQQAFPKAALPHQVWKYDDPLSKRDLKTLSQMLRDARPGSKDDETYNLQGSATWSSQLHFAWQIVMTEMLKPTHSTNRASFVDFWREVVEEGLFAPSASTERKHWGLMILQRAFSEVPAVTLSACFTKNVISCLIQSLKAGERYLQRSAQKAVQSLEDRMSQCQDEVPDVFMSIMKAINLVDFDSLSKSKTVENILAYCTPQQAVKAAHNMAILLTNPNTDDAGEATSRRKNVINIQQKFIFRIVNQAGNSASEEVLEPVGFLLKFWINSVQGREVSSELTPNPPFTDVTLNYIRERINQSLEQALKLGQSGRLLAIESVQTLHGNNANPEVLFDADDAINDIIRAGWSQLSKIQHHFKQHSLITSDGEDNHSTISEGIALLYALILYQTYNNEPDAVDVLSDLLEYEANRMTSVADVEIDGSADDLVEIILSFASRPSKFLRRMTLDIFASFAPQISANGLQSLTDILGAKETKEGQQELFEAQNDVADVEGEGSGSSGEEDSDDDLDSDVEVVDVEEDSATESRSESEQSSTSSNDSDSQSAGSEPDADADDELAALEKSLAAALGTRKLTSADVDDKSTGSDSDSNSDSDMTDSEMLELDVKLAEVFRNRVAASNKTKKDESKSAKENIVNFKNRVLDMVDIYLKSQHMKADSLTLILPLLTLARETGTKQLATRSIELVKSLCTKCKGLTNAPVLVTKTQVNGHEKRGPLEYDSNDDSNIGDKEDVDEEGGDNVLILDKDFALSLLKTIHAEACLASTSNAHRAACSQVSILIVKSLVGADVNIKHMVDIYASTRLAMLRDGNCKVHEGFFVDWGNWCGSVRGKLGGRGIATPAATSEMKETKKRNEKLGDSVDDVEGGIGGNKKTEKEKTKKDKDQRQQQQQLQLRLQKKKQQQQQQQHEKQAHQQSKRQDKLEPMSTPNSKSKSKVKVNGKGKAK